MPRIIKFIGTTLTASLLLTAFTGCASGPQSQSGTKVQETETTVPATTHSEVVADEQMPSPSNQQTTQEADVKAKQEADEKAKQEAEEKARKEAEEKAKKEAKEAKNRERKLIKTELDLEMARIRLDKARLSAENTFSARDDSEAKARAELDLSTKKLKTFQEITIPNRTAWAKLNLQRAEDGLKNAQEELQQLELMYKDEQFADQTKEIVIDRARRQLERTQSDLELRRDELNTLVEIDLPMELTEHQLRQVEKERALAHVLREVDIEKMDQKLNLMNAEAEIVRLENELVDLQQEIAEAQAQAAQEKQDSSE
ncbi:MAG: hypothetical protein ABIG44_19730 [Planctomycetota bacterium]